MSRFNSFSRPSRSAAYRASESSESGLLDQLNSPSQDPFGNFGGSDMAQLHPPYVTEAHAVAVQERATDHKRFVFQIDLKWSDDSSSTSYRSYSEFFDFQCDLLTEFPKEAGSQKGEVRTIPFLPGKRMFQKNSRKLAESRLPQIDEYVKALILLPENVSQSERTIRFFRSNWQEDKVRNGEGGDSVRYTVVRQSSKAQLLADGASADQEYADITSNSSDEHNSLSGI